MHISETAFNLNRHIMHIFARVATCVQTSNRQYAEQSNTINVLFPRVRNKRGEKKKPLDTRKLEKSKTVTDV